MAYLLLGCILLEDALPFFADANLIEFCDSKTENSEKEGKQKKGIGEDEILFKERLEMSSLLHAAFFVHPGSITADSDEIPDSANQSIFSPPPNRA